MYMKRAAILSLLFSTTLNFITGLYDFSCIYSLEPLLLYHLFFMQKDLGAYFVGRSTSQLYMHYCSIDS